MRLPRDGRDVPIHVTIVRTSRGETWTRDFAGRRMHSVLRARAGLLEERLGAATFRFAMRVEAGVLRWHLVAVRVLGIPLPLTWFDGVRATEEETAQGRYRFDVRAALPLVGLLVHYRGQLDAA